MSWVFQPLEAASAEIQSAPATEVDQFISWINSSIGSLLLGLLADYSSHLAHVLVACAIIVGL